VNDLASLLDLSFAWEYRHLLIRGLMVNIQVFAMSAAIAVLLGLVLASAMLRGPGWSRGLTTGFAEFMRNIPEYVLIIWMFIALPFLLTRLTGTRISFGAMPTAVVALGLVFSAYFAETFRAGFQATSPGQTEAAAALGMMPRQITGRILIPQVLLRLAPEMLNVSISLFKTTSILSLIGIQDVMYQASTMSGQLTRPVPIYTGAAIMFVGTIIIASLVVRLITAKLHERMN
jgi:polar amino acid transport system permease protein